MAIDIKQRSNQLRPRLSHYHWKQVNLKDVLSFQWLFFVRELDKFKRLQVFNILKFNFQGFFYANFRTTEDTHHQEKWPGNDIR